MSLDALQDQGHKLIPKKAVFQGHCSNKLDVTFLFVYYIIVSEYDFFYKNIM